MVFSGDREGCFGLPVGSDLTTARSSGGFGPCTENVSFREGTQLLMTTTSTSEVQLRAQTALASSPIYELRDLQVEHRQGTLVISGTVSSFYHKQLAQEVVRSVCRSIEVINSIRVE